MIERIRKIFCLAITAVSLCIVFLLIDIAVAHAAELKAVRQQIDFLNDVKATDNDTYKDFILRFSPFDFLLKLEDALVAVEGMERTNIYRRVEIYKTGQMPSAGLIEDVRSKKKVDQNIAQFLMENKDNQLSLKSVFEQQMAIINKLNAFNSSLYRIKVISNPKEILELDPAARLARLRPVLENVIVADGFNPKLAGYEQSNFSGQEFLHHYEVLLRAERQMLPLFMLVTSAQGNDALNRSVGEHCRTLLNSKDILFSHVQSADEIFEKAKSLFFKFSYDPSKIYRKLANDLYALKPVKNAAPKPWLTLEETDLKSALRGCRAGDCATRNSPAQSFVPGEYTFWITTSQGRSDAYMQMSFVIQDDGKPALFIHSISGTTLSKEVTLDALRAIFLLKDEFGAKSIILPTEERLRAFINFIEPRQAFQQVIQSAAKIKFSYPNATIRREISKFAENEIDIPERNTEGALFEPKTSDLAHLSYQVTKTERKSYADYAKTSTANALLIAVEVGAYGKSVPLEFFSSYGINKSKFDEILRVLSNPGNELVNVFQEKAQRMLADNGLAMSLSQLSKSHILFRGHMKAPDAVEGANIDLALSYLEPHLTSYDKSSYIYSLISPHMRTFAKNVRFHQIVRDLFKDNYSSLGKPLTHLEITTKSARRTLFNLFSNGLNVDTYASDLERLKPMALTNSDNSEKALAVFIRANTFLGSVYDFKNQYTEILLTHFEKFAHGNAHINYEDLKVVASYLAVALERGALSHDQLRRLNALILTTGLGLDLGFQILRIEQKSLEEEKLIDRLLENKRYKDASLLLYADRNAGRPSSSRWLAVLLRNRSELTFDQLYRMFADSPSWLKVTGSGEAIAVLLADSNKTTLTERLMKKIINNKKQVSDSTIIRNSCVGFYKGNL